MDVRLIYKTFKSLSVIHFQFHNCLFSLKKNSDWFKDILNEFCPFSGLQPFSAPVLVNASPGYVPESFQVGPGHQNSFKATQVILTCISNCEPLVSRYLVVESG